MRPNNVGIVSCNNNNLHFGELNTVRVKKINLCSVEFFNFCIYEVDVFENGNCRVLVHLRQGWRQGGLCCRRHKQEWWVVEEGVGVL